MIALALFAFIIAIIISLIVKTVEVAAESTVKVVEKTSELGKYVKNSWKEANEELREADREQRNL
jgi:hypothetical protein